MIITDNYNPVQHSSNYIPFKVNTPKEEKNEVKNLQNNQNFIYTRTEQKQMIRKHLPATMKIEIFSR